MFSLPLVLQPAFRKRVLQVYYRNISGNYYKASPSFANSHSPDSCNSFNSISVDSTSCILGGTSVNLLFIATANVPVTCLPIDDHVWLSVL